VLAHLGRGEEHAVVVPVVHAVTAVAMQLHHIILYQQQQWQQRSSC
jgi:hypothetical protein